MAGTVVRHPLSGAKATMILRRRLLGADFGHHGCRHRPGAHRAGPWRRDFELGASTGSRFRDRRGGGTYYPRCALRRQHVYKVDGEVAAALQAAPGALIAPRQPAAQHPALLGVEGAADLPQCRRVVHLDERQRRRPPRLPRHRLQAIEQVRWVPAGRPRTACAAWWRAARLGDLNAQRAWGVPLAILRRQASGEPLRDPEVNQRIAEAFDRKAAMPGTGAMPTASWAGLRSGQVRRRSTTSRGWFDSGSTQAFVLEQRPTSAWPADHLPRRLRPASGWFGASLMGAGGTRGRAPFKAVLPTAPWSRRRPQAVEVARPWWRRRTS